MTNRKFFIDHVCICTSDGKIKEGQEYIFREGFMKEPVVIKKISYDDEWLKLKLYFIREGKTKTVSHKNVDFVYTGMWKILDRSLEIGVSISR